MTQAVKDNASVLLRLLHSVRGSWYLRTLWPSECKSLHLGWVAGVFLEGASSLTLGWGGSCQGHRPGTRCEEVDACEPERSVESHHRGHVLLPITSCFLVFVAFNNQAPYCSGGTATTSTSIFLHSSLTHPDSRECSRLLSSWSQERDPEDVWVTPTQHIRAAGNWLSLVP